MSVSTLALVTARFGTSRNPFDVQLLKFPRSDAPLLEKVQAFAYFEEVVRQHRSQLTSLLVQQAYATHVPVSSSASASEEANRVSILIYDAFFTTSNLTCLGFFKSDGSSVPISIDPCDRQPSISFVSFSATVKLASFSPTLLDSAVPLITIQFYLPLPQSNIPIAYDVTASAAHDDDAAAAATSTADAANDDDSATAITTAQDAPPATPDTKAMANIRKLFATGGNIASLNLTSPKIVAALASIIRNTSSSASSTKRQLFPTDASSTLPAASPSIRRYLTTAAASDNSSFCGSLNFLDTQLLFDAVFPPLLRQPIFILNSTVSSATAGADTHAPTADAIQTCLSECRMLVFKAMLRLDYIGHHNFASADHLQVTVKRLRGLTLKYNIRGVTIDGNPDMLFDKYLALIPLLPATHVNVWGINLFTQFWHALGEQLTRRISLLPRYLAIYTSEFDLTTMTTKDRQMSALRELRSLAVESWYTLQEDKKSMRDMLREMHPGNNRSNTHVLESSTNVSSAEATMQRYSPPEDSQPSPAIHTHHQTPGTTSDTAVSDFAPEFRGCLGCGIADHVFRSCPMRDDPATIKRFHWNYNIKFNRPQRDQSPYGPPRGSRLSFEPVTGSPPAFGTASTNSGSGRGILRNQPAWMTQQQHIRTGDDASSNPVSAPQVSTPSPPKKARNFPLFVRSCQQQADISPALRPMPIRVDNGLPHLCLNLGLDSDATLSVLFDSGAALSSGYLPYHLWIMRENPDIVASFERFDDSNPFEPIKLGGAIRHPDDYNASLHGQLTAIIRYKTPYFDNDGSPIRISFGLGNDMTVNTILGMPVIKDLGMLPNFRTAVVTCDDSPATFEIRYHETSCGFHAQDDAVTTFATLPIEDMYPSLLASDNPIDDPPTTLPPDDCIAAIDDHTHGFLQRHLHSS